MSARDPHAGDPARLLEDPATAPELRRLLDAASPTAGPSRAATDALLAHAATLGPAPTATGTTLPWIGVGALVAGGLALLTVARGPAEPPAAPDAANDPAPATATPSPELAPPRVQVPVARRDVAPPPPAAPADVTPPTRPRTVRSAFTGDTLAEEQALLERARGRLAADPASALALLRTHGMRFPDGQLAAEREFLAIRALRKLGRAEDAAARRERFLRRYPGSPYVPLL